MGKKNQHNNVINELVLKTRNFSNKQKLELIQEIEKDCYEMGKKLEVYSVIWKNNKDEIINDVEHGFDELHAIDLIKQSPGFVSLIYIKKFPLTKEDMEQRFELSGVKPT